jgi:Cu/Ag efflux protein CusF
MKLLSIALLATLAAAPAAHAQASKADTHAAHHPAAAAAADMAVGEVRKVDKAQSKITLKHGEIKALDMPPMTMVFGVKDKALLDKVKEGEKVRFKAAIDGGKYFVTEIAALPR